MVGASGAIGSAIVDGARTRGWNVLTAGRGSAVPSPDVVYDIDAGGFSPLTEAGPFDAVCWAQGANLADSPASFEAESHLALYKANVMTVAHGLSQLVQQQMLAPSGARLCIISSVWQEQARAERFSYVITKSAVGGLVRAASADLAPAGHLMNAVLPGVIDTPMARHMLAETQIAKVEAMTGAGRLADMESVVAATLFLLSPENRAITGQSVAVDLGFGIVRAL